MTLYVALKYGFSNRFKYYYKQYYLYNTECINYNITYTNLDESDANASVIIL